MTKPDLSIIILSYNTKKITEDCIISIFKSLVKSNLSIEIIVVDNASSDGSVKILDEIQKSKFKNQNDKLKFKIIKNDRNLGYGRANNQAVEQCNSDYLLFLNSDILVLDNAIEKLYNFYRLNENLINFLGGKLLNKDLSSQPSCGPFYTLPVILITLFFKGDYLGITRNSPNKLTEVDWISGACLLTKKEYFNKVGRFDENIFMYMDEIDLLYRAKKAMFKVFFYPDAKFIHLGFASSGSKSSPVIQVFSGLLYFYKKHYGKLAFFMLKFMLKLKAKVSLVIGKLTNNTYLIETYEKAHQLVEMDR